MKSTQRPSRATQYRYKLAISPAEWDAYFQLRRAIFAEEQSLFQGSDEDAVDEIAYPIVAIATLPETPFPSQPFFPQPPSPQIVGVVRIYESEPGLWYGGRLGVHLDYRRVGQIGKGLIYKAVTTAHSWGCQRFLATVQLQNVKFFRRQHWHSLEEITLCDRPHHLMEADLNHYPASGEPRPLLLTRTCAAS